MSEGIVTPGPLDRFEVEVLLPDGAWYLVQESSFEIGDYPILDEGESTTAIYTGQEGLFELGASWIGQDEGERYACSLKAIRAVRCRA